MLINVGLKYKRGMRFIGESSCTCKHCETCINNKINIMLYLLKYGIYGLVRLLLYYISKLRIPSSCIQ